MTHRAQSLRKVQSLGLATIRPTRSSLIPACWKAGALPTPSTRSNRHLGPEPETGSPEGRYWPVRLDCGDTVAFDRICP